MSFGKLHTTLNIMPDQDPNILYLLLNLLLHGNTVNLVLVGTSFFFLCALTIKNYFEKKIHCTN